MFGKFTLHRGSKPGDKLGQVAFGLAQIAALRGQFIISSLDLTIILNSRSVDLAKRFYALPKFINANMRLRHGNALTVGKGILICEFIVLPYPVAKRVKLQLDSVEIQFAPVLAFSQVDKLLGGILALSAFFVEYYKLFGSFSLYAPLFLFELFKPCAFVRQIRGQVCKLGSNLLDICSRL